MRFSQAGERFDTPFVGIDLRWRHQHARIADDRKRRHAPAQSDMQRHHGALAEADQRERRGRQLTTGELRADWRHRD